MPETETPNDKERSTETTETADTPSAPVETPVVDDSSSDSSSDSDSGSESDSTVDITETERDRSFEPAASDREPELRHGRANKQRLVRSVPKKAIRAVNLDIDGSGDTVPGVELKVLQYNIVDDYGSVWLPTVLNKGLGQRLPQLAWAHNWADVIGRAIEWQDTSEGPIINFYFDDFDAVPRAKQANAQVKSGTIDDCSVGFGWNYLWRPPTPEEETRWPGCCEIIIEAELDEVSLVLRGAVPGAKVLTSRSAQRSMLIDQEIAAQLMVQVAQGNMTVLDALNAIQDAAVPGEDRDIEGPPGNYVDQDSDEGNDVTESAGCTCGCDDCSCDGQNVTVTVSVDGRSAEQERDAQEVADQAAEQAATDQANAEREATETAERESALEVQLLAALNKVMA